MNLTPEQAIQKLRPLSQRCQASDEEVDISADSINEAIRVLKGMDTSDCFKDVENRRVIEEVQRWAQLPEDARVQRLNKLNISNKDLNFKELKAIQVPPEIRSQFLRGMVSLGYWTMAMLLEFVCILPAGLLSIVSKMNLNPKAEGVKNIQFPPVLFLHGVHHNQSAGLIGKAYFKLFSLFSKEIPPVEAFYMLSYDGIFSNQSDKTIDDYIVEKVLPMVKKIKEETGQYPIIIGHSLGGLIASRLAQMEEEKSEVHIDEVWMLGSPYKGSPVADFLDDLGEYTGLHKIRKLKVEKELRTDAKVLEEIAHRLQEDMEAHKCMYRGVYSLHDELVPYNCSIITDGNYRKTLKGVGHLGLLFDFRAWWFLWQQWISIVSPEDRELD